MSNVSQGPNNEEGAQDDHVVSSSKRVRTIRGEIEALEAGRRESLLFHRKKLGSLLEDALRRADSRYLSKKRTLIWQLTLSFQGPIHCVQSRLIKLPMRVLFLAIMVCFYSATTIAILNNLWIFYPILLGVLWLFYSSSRWAVKSVVDRDFSDKLEGLECLRFWLFTEYIEGDEHPHFGSATPFYSTVKWDRFESYGWKFSNQPDLRRDPLLLEIRNSANGILACYQISSDHRRDVRLLFHNLEGADKLLAVLTMILSSAVKILPAGYEERLKSDIQNEKKLEMKRETLEACQKAVTHTKQTSGLWDDIYLRNRTEATLKDRVRSFNVDSEMLPGSLLITGAEGTGKTLLVSILKSASAHFCECYDAEDFWQYQHGPIEASKRVWSTLLQHQGRGVLIIDGIDRLLYPEIEKENTMKSNFLHTFLEGWDEAVSSKRVWIVATARDRLKIHRELRSRFVGEEHLKQLDLRGVRFVADKALDEAGLQIDFDDQSLSSLKTLTPRAIGLVIKKAIDAGRPGVPTTRHINEAASKYVMAQGTAVDPSARWDSLILVEETKRELQRIMHMLRDAENLSNQAIDVPGGLLLHGPPGTGKTQIARTLANESGLSFMAVTVADLKAEYIGHSAPKTRDVFARARSQQPCILFIDEIDTCAGRRVQSDSFLKDVVTQMLTEMDGAAKSDALVFVVGATNLYSEIDSAVLSRFDEKIEIPLPGREETGNLLRLFLRERRLGFELEPALADLVTLFSGQSGRDLKKIVKKAQRRAVGRAMDSDDKTVILQLEDLKQVLDRRMVTEDELKQVWNRIVLPKWVKERLLRMVRLFNDSSPAAPKGTLLYGPPGTGKSLIAKRLAESCNCEFLSLTVADLKGTHIGDGADLTKKLWQRAREAGKALIFLDECDALFAGRGSMESDSYSKDVVSTFLAEWDGVASSGKVWVVGATNRKDVLDTAILQRFGESLEIGLPDGEARLEILNKELENMGLEVDLPSELAEETSGLSGRGISKLAAKIVGMGDGEIPTSHHFKQAISEMREGQSTATSKGASWEALVVSEDLLSHLKDIGQSLRHIDYFEKNGMDPPTALLLHGPPGTGKTQIARTLAAESGVSFLAASTSDVKGQHVGESGQKTTQLFAKAREQSPCILFLDEIDAIAPDRQSSHDSFSADIANQILQEMDGIKAKDGTVFVVAATNHLNIVDAAIRSRFEDKVEVPLPEDLGRRRMLEIFLGDLQCKFDREEWIVKTAEATEGSSGRDLKNLVKKAAKKAALRAVKAGATEPPVIEIGDFKDLT